MKLRSPIRRASARGLTLIELVVVLAILVALAGLIIGNFPSLLKKASGSTSANTIQDIGRAMSIRYTTKGSYATAFDNLEKAILPAQSLAQISTNTPIPAADATALADLGVTSVCSLLLYPTAAPDATWSVSTAGNIAAIASGTTPIALVTDATLVSKLAPNQSGYAPPIRIYLLGVGKVCSLVGGDSTLLEAPTRTGASDLDNSAQFYQRYCVAFLVDGPAGNRKARFIGSVAPTAVGFEVTDDATKTYQTN